MKEIAELRRRVADLETAETEHKGTEKALKESEQRYRRIFESCPEIIGMIDKRGNLLDVNRRLYDLFGYEPEEAIGRNFLQLPFLPDESKATAGEKLSQAMVGKDTGPYELDFITKGGERRVGRIVSSPVRDESGRLVGELVMASDITERKQAEEALKRATLQTLEAVSNIVEARDPYTAGHSTTVTKLAIEIAEEMGLGEEQLDILRIAGPLHDLGKVGIPGSVLNKPAKLTQAEWAMVEAHPILSADAIARVTAFKDAIPVIRYHHERWDGKGYPNRLKGEETPLLSRILAVANSFDAMTSERPHRMASTAEKSLAELEEGAGTWWDPEVVKALSRVIKSPSKGDSSSKSSGATE